MTADKSDMKNGKFYFTSVGFYLLTFSNLFVLRIDVLSRRRHSIISRLDLRGDKQVLLRLQKVCAVVNREFEVVSVRDRILRTRLYTITAEDAAAIIDVVNLGVTFVDTDAFLGQARIVFSNNVNAVRRASGRAQKTGHAFLSAELVDVQQMLPAVARLDSDRLFGILHGPLTFRDVR